MSHAPSRGVICPKLLESFNGGPGNCPAKPGGYSARPYGILQPSMEGRAIARPNDRLLRLGVGLRDEPSMEGRAIARPNPVRPMSHWMGGRGLQWRAGQLPGQTAMRPDITRTAFLPSMEGRAIARPNTPTPSG